MENDNKPIPSRLRFADAYFKIEYVLSKVTS